MKDRRVLWRLFSLPLFCLLLSPLGFTKEDERLSLKAEKGAVSFVAEMARPPASGQGLMSVHLTVEKGRISLIGENGIVAGYIGENGRIALASGIKSLSLVDGQNRTLGTAEKSGNIRMIIGDSGRVALIGENGRSVGYIGENGLVKFQESLQSRGPGQERQQTPAAKRR